MGCKSKKNILKEAGRKYNSYRGEKSLKKVREDEWSSAYFCKSTISESPV